VSGTPSPRAIALLGLRGAGKTSVGRALALELRLPFVDLDEELAALHVEQGGTARSAGELLAALGEPAFRELEARALERVLARGALVLATGGGVVERAGNRERLADGARCVWLRVPADELRRRLAADPTPRPALLGGDPLAEIEALARRREPHYAALARVVLDAHGAEPAALARALAARLL
jgi:shikimate kinase